MVTGGAGNRSLGAVRELAQDMRHHIGTMSALLAAVEQGDRVVDGHVLRTLRDETESLRSLCERVLGERRSTGTARIDELVVTTLRRGLLRRPCRASLDAEPCIAAADEVDVQRIFDNLIDKALRAASPDGRVEIVVRRSHGGVAVAIADTGPGSGASDQGATAHGSGLGLAIVRNLVERSGGTLTIDTSLRGRGLVEVVLPAADGDPGSGCATGPAQVAMSRADGGRGSSHYLPAQFLTPREREVLEGLVRGRNAHALADELGIRYSTVRTHIQNLLAKLGVNSQLEAVALATSESLVEVPERRTDPRRP